MGKRVVELHTTPELLGELETLRALYGRCLATWDDKVRMDQVKRELAVRGVEPPPVIGHFSNRPITDEGRLKE